MGFVSELKRRRVLRMLVLYVIAAWLIMQVAEVVITLGNLPDWVGPLVLGLLALGLPIALILSWFYELTPEGLALDKDGEPAAPAAHLPSRRMDFIVIALLTAGLLLFAYDKWAGIEPSEQSIAVLPFQNMNPDDERTGFLANGIHENLLTQLSKLGSFKVISRTSVERYRNMTLGVPEIAAELGVRKILEGSVQGTGKSIRVNVQLIDAKTDEHIWAETYDRDLTAKNLFAMQSDIVETIANQLDAKLTPEENQRLADMPTRNFDAYSAYLRGRNNANIQSVESMNNAVEDFKEAIDLDPEFALAYAGLADAYLTLGGYFHGGLTLDESSALAEPPIVQALALDQDLGEAHAMLGTLRMQQGNLSAAEQAYKRALALRPSYARAFQMYGQLRERQGRRDDAMELYRKALVLDPYSAPINYDLGRLYDKMGQFDKALTRYQRIVRIEPDHAFAYVYIAAIHYLVQCRVDDALVWYYEAASNDALSPSLQAAQALGYLEIGDTTNARYWIDRSIELGADTFWSAWSKLLLSHRTSDEESIRDDARALLEIAPGAWGALAFLRNADIAAERYDVAMSRYAHYYPDLAARGGPKIHKGNYNVAVEYAVLLRLTGEDEVASRMLEGSLDVMTELPRLGIAGYYIADVKALALLGRTEEAIERLRTAIDEGWCFMSWYFLDHDPALASLRGHPEFERLRTSLRAELAKQAAHVKDMQASGELGH